jgi:hypothetical protein
MNKQILENRLIDSALVINFEKIIQEVNLLVK